jgi:succinate dehydrogenase / fumarate reductase cytochrome b subunit
MTTGERPLSPHLQVYRWQITMTLSILHRATGLALAAGTLLLAWWLLALAAGPEAYATAQGFIGSWFGRLILFGWTWSLFHHLCGGLRHLAWDAGYGFEIPQFYRSGWAVVIAAVVLTLIAWFWGYGSLGAFG